MIAWYLAGAAVLSLGILAPVVPDEPFHVSGVMVIVGVVCAFFGILSGIATAVGLRSKGLQSGRPLLAAGLSALTLVGSAIWLYLDALDDLG